MARLRRLAGRVGRQDVVAGLLLSTLLIPAGMGYATASGMPPVAGLHATVIALLVYAVVGPTAVLVMGPDSSLVPLVAAAVVPVAAGDPGRALALGGLLAVCTGAVLMLGAACRLGTVTDLLSKPIRIGYLHGVALVVVSRQLPSLLGVAVEPDGVWTTTRRVVRHLADGAFTARAAVVGLGVLAAVLVLRRLAPRFPAMLVALVAAGVFVRVWGAHGIAVVGDLPRGLPRPRLSGLGWADVRHVVPAAVAVAVVALADTAALSRSLAAHAGDRVDDTREMAALGAVNVACGALGGFPVSASATRSVVVRESGGASKAAGVVGAFVVAGLLVAAPTLTRQLPSAALAAIVVAAVLSLVDVRALRALWRMSTTEFLLCTATFVGVAVAGVLEGIVVAAVLSLAAFVARAWRPHHAVLVRVDGRKGYHDHARHPAGRHVPGLVIVRFDAPLFFANGAYFTDVVRAAVEGARAEHAEVRWVAVAAEPITDIDTTAAESLVALDDELRAQGIRLVFAEMKGPVKDHLVRFGLAARFAGRHYPTIGTAVSAYLDATGAEWADWTDEERRPGTSGPVGADDHGRTVDG